MDWKIEAGDFWGVVAGVHKFIIEMDCRSVLRLSAPLSYRCVHCMTWCSFVPEVVFCSGKCSHPVFSSCPSWCAFGCVFVLYRRADPQRTSKRWRRRVL